MRNLIFTTLFVCAGFGVTEAQSYSNAAPQAQGQAMPSSFPTSLVWKICNAAQPDLYPFTGMSTQQLYNAYFEGIVSIQYLGSDPDNPHYSLYRVSAGGGVVIESIIDDF